MTGYIKLFNSILTSTVWDLDSDTRAVWITMLVLADADGVVEGSLPGLAHQARVPLEKAKFAIQTFLAADEYSRTTDHDGRRIEVVDGGWHLLNYDRYRVKLDKEEQEERRRERQARWRDAKRRSETVGDGERRPETPGDAGDAKRRQAEAKADERSSSRARDPGSTDTDSDSAPWVWHAQQMEAHRRSVPCLTCGHPWTRQRSATGEFWGHGRKGSPLGCRETCPVEEYETRRAAAAANDRLCSRCGKYTVEPDQSICSPCRAEERARETSP